MRISDLSADELRKLNSATQYPSILTYHVLGQRGRLTEARTADFRDEARTDVIVTEKIDGTNARIILPPRGAGSALVGSRTELLHSVGDIIHNPAQGIVDTVRPWLDSPPDFDSYDFTVVFGEVYGGKASSGSKNYTANTAVTGFRVFDVAAVPASVLGWDIEKIAAWRDGAGQTFMSARALDNVRAENSLDGVPVLAAGPPPVTVADTHAWLTRTISRSHAPLDDTGKGRPEGVVVRTADRSQIVKIRFEDYERTAKTAARDV
jgi:hypothetical protein